MLTEMECITEVNEAAVKVKSNNSEVYIHDLKVKGITSWPILFKPPLILIIKLRDKLKSHTIVGKISKDCCIKIL